MSTVTPERAADLRCPRCDAPLRPDQDWCLECGTAATTRVLSPPSWGVAALIVLAVVALAGIALALAVDQLSGEADRAASRASPADQTAAAPAATGTTTATAAPPAATPTTPTAPPTPTTATAPAAGATPAIASWPLGRRGWTVIVRQTRNRAEAEQRARQLAGQGVQVGLLRSSDFTTLDQGFWMVFSGVFSSQAQASAHQRRLGRRAPPTAYFTAVTPRGR